MSRPADTRLTCDPQKVRSWLAAFVETMPCRVGLFSTSGEILYLNHAAQAWLPIPLQAEEECRLEDLQPAWACALLRNEAIPSALCHGSWRGKSALRHPNGSELPVDQTFLMLKSDDGQIVAALWRDLSWIEATDRERLATTTSYDVAIRSSGQIQFCWDQQTDGIKFLGALPDWLEEATSQCEMAVQCLYAYVDQRDRESLKQQLRGACLAKTRFSVAFRLEGAQGRGHRVFATGEFYQLSDDSQRLCAGLFRVEATGERDDLPSRSPEEWSALLDAARTEAAAAQTASSETLSRISHVLRTPLNAILGFTQLMGMEPATARQAESLEHIAKAGQTLLTLINGILKQPHVLESLPRPDEQAKKEPSRPVTRHCILYVEDDVLNVQLIERVMEELPAYELISAGSGQEALLHISTAIPDLILLDVNLPDLSGDDLLARLKNDPATQRIPIIMVSADIMGDRGRKLLAAGALTYLTKPFRISELLEVIRAALPSEINSPQNALK